MAPRYFQKEAIKIPDTVGLIINILTDDLRNHRLKEIIPHENIIRRIPQRWKQFPGIKVERIAFNSMVKGEPIAENEIGYVWSEDILITMFAQERTKFYYPPFNTDEENRYQQPENTLPVIHWIIHNIMSENTKFTDPDDETFKMDWNEPGDFDWIEGGYQAIGDLWAVEQVYRCQFEITMRDET